MNPFKKGDRVRVIDGQHNLLPLGNVYTVAKVDPDFVFVGHPGKMDGWFYDRFELVERDGVKDAVEYLMENPVPSGSINEKGDWIIIVEKNGVLAPALTPKRYKSEPQAKTVAQSMAQKHPGDKFFILKIVGEAQTFKASVRMY